MGLIDPRVLATASGAVFAGLSRITQMVGQDGTFESTSERASRRNIR
jgi:hypothetical protein